MWWANASVTPVGSRASTSRVRRSTRSQSPELVGGLGRVHLAEALAHVETRPAGFLARRRARPRRPRPAGRRAAARPRGNRDARERLARRRSRAASARAWRRQRRPAGRSPSTAEVVAQRRQRVRLLDAGADRCARRPRPPRTARASARAAPPSISTRPSPPSARARSADGGSAGISSTARSRSRMPSLRAPQLPQQDPAPLVQQRGAHRLGGRVDERDRGIHQADRLGGISGPRGSVRGAGQQRRAIDARGMLGAPGRGPRARARARWWRAASASAPMRSASLPARTAAASARGPSPARSQWCAISAATVAALPPARSGRASSAAANAACSRARSPGSSSAYATSCRSA